MSSGNDEYNWMTSGVDLDVRVPFLNEIDRAFAQRLMVHPAMGMAWAGEAWAGEDELTQTMAVWCCLQHQGNREDHSNTYQARLKGLAHPHWGEWMASELPKLWLTEPDGIDAWMQSLGDFYKMGVSEKIANELCTRAVSEDQVQSTLNTLDLATIETWFDRLESVPTRSARVWQVEMAKHLGARLSRSRLQAHFVESADVNRPEPLSREVCFVMMQQVISDPEEVYHLIHAFMMKGFCSLTMKNSGGLAGLFDALCGTPKPTLAKAPKGRSLKMLDGFRVPLFLSMELMIQGQFEAGLVAARWAFILGGGGQEPVQSVSDGLSQRKLCADVPAFGFNRWGNQTVCVRGLSEVAVLYGRVDVCDKLRDMGWGLPSRKRMVELSEDLSKLGALAVGYGMPCLLFDISSSSDAGLQVMAFWESQYLTRKLKDRCSEGLKRRHLITRI